MDGGMRVLFLKKSTLTSNAQYLNDLNGHHFMQTFWKNFGPLLVLGWSIGLIHCFHSIKENVHSFFIGLDHIFLCS